MLKVKWRLRLPDKFLKKISRKAKKGKRKGR